MAFLTNPEDYEALGVAPPESVPHGTEEDQVQARALGDHTCRWHQQGSDVFCEAGPHRHGKHYPPSHILTGTGPGGEPLFRIIDIPR
jgi:hypothetical protein